MRRDGSQQKLFRASLKAKMNFAMHCLCACEFQPSDLYALREITLVGQLLLLSVQLIWFLVANNLKTRTVTV